MPKTIALEDDGIFIITSYFGSVAHPPGYPLYTAISHLFAQIPIGSVASRVHFVSALFGALSCATLFLVFRSFHLSVVNSILLSIVFATSKTFWSQSIIAEVYSLNILLLILSFLIVQKIRLTHEADENLLKVKNYLICLYLTLGLGVSNHWPLFVLAMPSFAILLWKFRTQILKEWYLIFYAFLIASIFYAYLIFTTQFNENISIFGPFSGILDFFHFVSRAHYFETDREISANVFDKLAYVQLFIKETAYNFHLLLVILILCARKFKNSPNAELVWSLAWLFLSSSVIVILLLGKEFNELNAHVYKVYFIPSYLALFVLVAYVLAQFENLSKQYSSQKYIGIMIGTAVLLNFMIGSNNFRGSYHFGQQYGEELLSRIPQNSVLFVDGDIQLGVIGYLVLIEGKRPDITLMSSESYMFNNRLYHKSASPMAIYQTLSEFIDKSERPVIFADNVHRLIPLKYSFLYAQPVPLDSEAPKSAVNHLLELQDLKYIESLTHHKDRSDPWTDIFIRRLLARAVKHLSLTQYREPDEQIRRQAEEMLTLIPKSFETEQLRLHVTHEYAGKDNVIQIRKDLLQLVSKFDADKSKLSKSTILNLLAENLLMTGQFDQARQLIIESCKIMPTADNKACKIVDSTHED